MRAFRMGLRGFILWSLVACGAGQDSRAQGGEEAAPPPPQTPVAVDPTPAPTATAPQLPELTPGGPQISLACARATAQLPTDFTFGEWNEPCSDSGYPQEIDAEGIGGGEGVHTILGQGCEFEIRASDRFREPAPQPGVHGDTLIQPTPEETTFEVSAESEDTACAALGAAVVRVLRETLRIQPLAGAVTRTHAQISSAGHGITLEIPVGSWLYSAGGAADEYETSYELLGPGDTRATLNTSWDPEADPSAPLRRFDARVISERGRPRPAGPGPYVDEVEDEAVEEECREMRTLGPEPRIVTSLRLCGPPEGDAALLAILRAARFTRPPPHAE